MNTSIFHMHTAMAVMEQVEDEFQKNLPANDERSHYWHVECKPKNGKKWTFVRELYATKSEAAETFRKFYRSREVKYRLRHKMAY